MRTPVMRWVFAGIALLILTSPIVGCNKTAEDTNKPVLIQGFILYVNGDVVDPAGTLQIEPGSILNILVEYTDPDAGDDPDPNWYSATWAVERVGVGISTFNPNDQFIVFDENPCIWEAPEVTGYYRFIVEVRDRYGTPSQETLVIEVNANKQPIITQIDISDTQPFVNAEVTVTVDAEDPDGNVPLKYTWQADGGYYTFESDGEARWLSPSSGDFVLTVIVEDQLGGSVSKDIPMVVQQNHSPVIQGWDLDPGNSVLVNDLVSITINASDLDDDPLEYNWTADSGTFNLVDENIAVWRAPGEAVSAKITCIVEDNRAGSDTAEITINVSAE